MLEYDGATVGRLARNGPRLATEIYRVASLTGLSNCRRISLELTHDVRPHLKRYQATMSADVARQLPPNCRIHVYLPYARVSVV